MTTGDKEPELWEERIAMCCSCDMMTMCIWGPDPYADEIKGDDTPVWECEGCRRSSAEDI